MVGKKKVQGFTLIELLVVIAIIAILSAILFPVFAKAREKARTASCQSNLKQLSTAVMMYAQDYDEVLPFCNLNIGGTITNFSGATNSVQMWPDSIMSYVKNRQAFICPSLKSDWIGYGYAIQLGYTNSVPPPSTYGIYTGVSLAQLKQPAITAMLCDHDSAAGTFNAAASGWYYAWYIMQYSLDRNGNSTVHSDGLNIAFVDGHVKWYRPTAAKDTGEGGPVIWQGCTWVGGC